MKVYCYENFPECVIYVFVHVQKNTIFCDVEICFFNKVYDGAPFALFAWAPFFDEKAAGADFH